LSPGLKSSRRDSLARSQVTFAIAVWPRCSIVELPAVATVNQRSQPPGHTLGYEVGQLGY
jgi:hypothetical protein